MTEMEYLNSILDKYKARDLIFYNQDINLLKDRLRVWAGNCYVNILDAGSRAKNTAIHLSSDVDYFISLTSTCNNTLSEIYNSLFTELQKYYPYDIRKQNVSIRIKIRDLEVDVTPGKCQGNLLNWHSIYKSKTSSWTQTNIIQHNYDILNSGRNSEIKLLKIWRELNNLTFPSIYLEYLLKDRILLGRSKSSDSLVNNFIFILRELSQEIINNPLNKRLDDPSNSNNVLSDLITLSEKQSIINKAKIASVQQNWGRIIW